MSEQGNRNIFKRLFGSKDTKPTPPPDTSPRAHPGEATDRDFAQKVLQAPMLAVVDFWADWCQPCTVMSAFVEFLARDFAGRLLVFALDVDENQRTSEEQKVMSLPTLVFYRDGVEVHRTVGVTTYEDLKRQTERLLKDSIQ